MVQNFISGFQSLKQTRDGVCLWKMMSFEILIDSFLCQKVIALKYWVKGTKHGEARVKVQKKYGKVVYAHQFSTEHGNRFLCCFY